MGFFAAGVALGILIAGAGFGYWYHTHELEREYQKELEIKADEVLSVEKLRELEVGYEEEIYQLRSDYDRASAELVRLRLENASLRGGTGSGASSECDKELAKREDLLLRMASLGLRTSNAVAEKQAALKNCVGSYDSLKAQ